MLLRSASTPILNSLISHPREAPPETEMVHQLQKPWHLTLSAPSSSLSFSPVIGDSAKGMTRSLSEADLSFSGKKSYPNILDGFPEVDEESEAFGYCYLKTASSQNGFFANTVLEGGWENEVRDVGLGVLVGEGGGGGGKRCGGSGGGGSDGGGDGRNDGTDLYYRKMIEANPGDSLLLGNYARFLKEVRGDLVKAENYCGRAILSNPGDGNILSMYADLMWKSHKDATRAENYFDQAVKASPDDCYVLGSYAQFLWESGEEEEKSEEKTSSSSFQSHGVDAQMTPLAAAS